MHSSALALRSFHLFSYIRSSSTKTSVSLARGQQRRAFHTPYAVLYSAGMNRATAHTPSSRPVSFTYEKQLDTPVDSGAASQEPSSSSNVPSLTAAFSTSEDVVPSAEKNATVFPRVHVVSAPDPKEQPYEVPLGVYPAALPFSH